MPLKVKDGMGAWIKDFQKSDAPQFKGRSKDQRRDQAIAAYLSAKRGPQNESTHYDYDKSVEKDIKKRNRKVESSLEYAKSIEKINKKKRDDLLKPGEKDKIDKMRKMMKKANEDIAGGLTRRIGSLSNVTGASRGRAVNQIAKLKTQRSNVLAKNAAQRDINKRMQMNSTNEMMGNIGVRGSDGKAMGSAPRASSSSTYVGRRNDALSNLNRMAKKHDDRDHIDHAHALKAIDHAGDKLNKHGPDHAEYKKAYDAAKKKSAEAMKSESVKEATSAEKAFAHHKAKLKHHTAQNMFHTKKARIKFGTNDKGSSYHYDQADHHEAEMEKHEKKMKTAAKMMKKPTNESVKEGMTTGNEAGMMFRVKIEGLPDMIMVGRSPSDIKQQLRKIVKQPSMINSVDRMPKSQVRKMYRDLAGGKDIDENYLHDYGTPESVKMMKNMTPGQASSMLDKIMKIRKGKNKKQLGKNDAVED